MEIPEIKKRQVEDELKIGERTFKLTSYDPLLGNYLLMKLLTTVLPFGIGRSINEAVGTEAVQENVPIAEEGNVKMMSKKDFIEFQSDILKHCYEVLPGDIVPVVRENGTYGIDNFTMKIAIQLLIASVAFNFNDFFADDQSMLQSILG